MDPSTSHTQFVATLFGKDQIASRDLSPTDWGIVASFLKEAIFPRLTYYKEFKPMGEQLSTAFGSHTGLHVSVCKHNDHDLDTKCVTFPFARKVLPIWDQKQGYHTLEPVRVVEVEDLYLTVKGVWQRVRLVHETAVEAKSGTIISMSVSTINATDLGILFAEPVPQPHDAETLGLAILRDLGDMSRGTVHWRRQLLDELIERDLQVHNLIGRISR